MKKIFIMLLLFLFLAACSPTKENEVAKKFISIEGTDTYIDVNQITKIGCTGDQIVTGHIEAGYVISEIYTENLDEVTTCENYIENFTKIMSDDVKYLGSFTNGEDMIVFHYLNFNYINEVEFSRDDLSITINDTIVDYYKDEIVFFETKAVIEEFIFNRD